MGQPWRSHLDKNPGTTGVSNELSLYLYLGFPLSFSSSFLVYESVVLCQFSLYSPRIFLPFCIRLCHESQDKCRRDFLKQMNRNILRKGH